MSCRGSTLSTHSREAAVQIVVSPDYMPAEHANGHHWFSYHITIQNCGACPVQLLSRYWKITDGDNEVREVSGDGVVGRQPLISPGEEYEYVSYVNFATPIGYMEGHYVMRTDDSRLFQAAIGSFLLALPLNIH